MNFLQHQQLCLESLLQCLSFVALGMSIFLLVNQVEAVMVSFITTFCLHVWHARKQRQTNTKIFCGCAMIVKVHWEIYLCPSFCVIISIWEFILACQLNFEIVYLMSFDVSVWQQNSGFPAWRKEKKLTENCTFVLGDFFSSSWFCELSHWVSMSDV